MHIGKGSRRAGTAVLVAALISTFSVPAALASVAQKKKHLSMPTVTVVAGDSNALYSVWVAQDRGLFKSQGLTVNWLATNGGGSITTTALLAGSGQFGIDGATSELNAVQQGAPIRLISEPTHSSVQEIAISTNVASAKGIPASGTNAAGALAQLRALKGSHLNIAVSALTSLTYSWIVSDAKQYGLTVGVGTSGSTAYDINIISAGSIALEEAGLATGKYDGIGGIAPTTTQPNTIVIDLRFIKGASQNSAGQYLETTTSMISQHRDTVQAMVTGLLLGQQYLVQHPTAAEKLDAVGMATVNGGGITSPEQAQYLFVDYQVLALQPNPTKSSYNDIVQLLNGSQTIQITVPYSTVVDTKFITTAAKTLGINLNKNL